MIMEVCKYVWYNDGTITDDIYSNPILISHLNIAGEKC